MCVCLSVLCISFSVLPLHLVIICVRMQYVNACMYASISKYFALPIFPFFFHHFRTGFRSKRDPWWFSDFIFLDVGIDGTHIFVHYYVYYCWICCCCCILLWLFVYILFSFFLFFLWKKKKWIKSKNHPKYLLFLSEPLKTAPKIGRTKVRRRKK